MLKWNRYFSACENQPNSSCHFWKHKSVFLQILHQSSVRSNITPLYFFSSNMIYLGQKQPIKVQMFEIFKCSDQNFSNSSYQFWTDKSIPLCVKSSQWHITPLQILNSYIFYFTLDKRIPSKSQFWDFRVLWWKFAKFLMSFTKLQVSFLSNFASLFSFMKYNSSVHF